MPDWVEIAVKTPQEWVEAVSYKFRELGAGGVAIDDPDSLWKLKDAEPELRPDNLPVPGTLPAVKAYFPRSLKREKLQCITSFLQDLGLFPVQVETRVMREKDWQNAWKAYYKPVEIGKRLVIKPIWEEYSNPGEKIVIHMDPGQAFGSGTHATTAMCLELAEQYIKPGVRVLDVGTGSGILAIAAARLGAAKVIAVDSDPVAVDCARENAGRNGVCSVVTVREGNLVDGVEGTFQVIMANIISAVIIELVPFAVKLLEPGGYFIASGIIKDRLPEVCTAFKRAGLLVKEVREQGEWVALVACNR